MNVNDVPVETQYPEQTGSKKRLYVLIGGAISLVLLLGITIFMQKGNEGAVTLLPTGLPTVSAPTGFNTASPTLLLIPDDAVPTSPPTPPYTPLRIIVTDIAVSDFYKTAVRVDPNGDALLAENPDYQIRYVKEFQEFTVVVSGVAFDEARDRAEAKFIDMLGVDEVNACRLSVEVHIPKDVPNEFAGKIFPLSFCGDDVGDESD